MSLVFNFTVFFFLMFILVKQQQQDHSLSKRVFTGLIFGVLFGLALQFLYSENENVIFNTLEYVNLIGTGYISLLKMIVMPLILVSIVAAIIKVRDPGTLGKISFLSLFVLLGTTAVSAFIGLCVIHAFGLSSEGMLQGAQESAKNQELTGQLLDVSSLSLTDVILSFLPTNPFADLAGLRPTSTVAVVIFSAFLGGAGLGLMRREPALGASFEHFIDVSQELVKTLVRMVLSLTPYGVMALMSKVVADSNYNDIFNLFQFVLASYTGLLVIFCLHVFLVTSVGVKPVQYIKTIFPVLTFAFTSRSSAGTIPLNVETQIKGLGNAEAVAHFSASFGATMGQNGCAGLYPAMLVGMLAPTMGIDPFSLDFMLTFLIIVTVSSFGIAGVGGGATFAALIVLSTLNMPIALVGLLISIEPLIDMGRTAINVSGSLTAGTVTSRILGLSASSVVSHRSNKAEPFQEQPLS